jgi:hypothetical protein
MMVLVASAYDADFFDPEMLYDATRYPLADKLAQLAIERGRGWQRPVHAKRAAS